jgi:N-acetylglutamate synthase-like GNAT family acetyltransferase
MSEIIRQAKIKDAEVIAAIVSEANKDVAQRFNLNRENAPKHPSFCNAAWVKADFERRAVYFIYELDGVPLGCVSFEIASPDTAYLNRLSVLPSARSKGIGEKLVHRHIQFSKDQEITKISIGIIAAFTELKNWYLKLGFKEGVTKIFDHLPFQVCYMSIEL